MAQAGDTRDILGRTYEYCLSKFAEAEGKNAGEFYTPACVVRTLVEIIEPYRGRVFEIKTPYWIQINDCSLRGVA
jgi:type I restriction enzyme M protein